VLRGTAPYLRIPLFRCARTQRRGVGRGDADEVARVRERGVSEGDRRPVRVQIDDVEDVLVQQGVDVAVDGLPVEVVGGEVFGGQLDGVRVHVGAGGVVPSAAARTPRIPEAAIASRYDDARGSRSRYARSTATVTSRFSSCVGLKTRRRCPRWPRRGPPERRR